MSKSKCIHCLEEYDLFCHKCGKVNPITCANYFSLFGLEKIFNIDFKKLQRTYIELQQKFHPDKFITKAAKEKLIALNNSITVNEAYEILRSEVKRGEYLFTLLGGEPPKQIHDQEILVEELTKRELLEKDLSSEELDSLLHQTIEEKNFLLDKFAQCCTNLDLNTAYKFLTKLKFNIKFYDEIKHKKSQLL